MHRSIQEFFGGRNLLVATMHGKDNLLREMMEEALGVKVISAKNFDTDQFGTFSGEIERQKSPLETARAKCRAAYHQTGETLVLASEGSFGAHPVMGFIPANEEWLVLMDFKNDWEFKARVLSTHTNFGSNSYCDVEDALFFAAQAGFPSHAMIVRKSKDDFTGLQKGITNWDELEKCFAQLCWQYGNPYIETDMRAHLNPTRCKVIKEAGQKLIEAITQLCPVCEAPGFGVVDVLRGLPCGDCATPTTSAQAYLYQCHHCNHTERREHPHKKEKEDPVYCEQCNP